MLGENKQQQQSVVFVSDGSSQTQLRLVLVLCVRLFIKQSMSAPVFLFPHLSFCPLFTVCPLGLAALLSLNYV